MKNSNYTIGNRTRDLPACSAVKIVDWEFSPLDENSCWLFLPIYTAMHGSMNIKFINAQQAIEIHAYKNTKRKLYKKNAAIWFNKTLQG